MASPFDKNVYQPYDTFAFEALSVAGSSTALTAATYAPAATPPAKMAIARLETAQIRYRLDGTAPTATTGTPMDPGDEIIIYGVPDIASFRAIRTGGVSGTLDVHYLN